MSIRNLIAAFSFAALLRIGAHATGPADPEILEALEWREIGPPSWNRR